MDGKYVAVKPKATPVSKNPLSRDAKFWRSFRNKRTPQHIANVTSVDFCPVEPHDFAVTSSTQVIIYDGKTCEVKKRIARFNDVAYSGTFRSDGQVLAAGGQSGIIQVFEMASRQVLRQLKGHKGAVHWVQYGAQDKLHIASAGDDTTVRWWDVATSEPLSTLEGHTDYVRCGATSSASNNLLATGSYDHSICLWDIRMSKCVLRLQHGKPLEDVIFFPSGGLLTSAGGTEVKIWDIVGGGRQLQMSGSHQKTVTSLAMAAPGNSIAPGEHDSLRLLTGSLDGHVRVFELNQLKVTHVAKYSAPIMSMGLSPSCNTLAVGASTGLLSIRQRREPKSTEEEPISALNTIQPRSSKRLHPNNYRYFLRGHSEVTAADNVVVRPKQRRLGEHDKFLRQFQYREALSSALSTSDDTVVVAIMEELVARGGLVSAISNRDAPSLEPLLAFLCKYTVTPKRSRLLIPVAHRVLDIYASMFGLSSTIRNLVALLRDRVSAEVRMQQTLQHLQGVMQPLLHASVLEVENALK